ncbi:CRISPR-associated helicase Cas3' [Amycolatopsis cihanbeyliensis]|uniref:CRISPR-associated helicase Cas3' n=1 Tax=Amycolatopsis cihanbeyliensis TaxID=1128664 RepID=UPI00114E4D91|nr:CRISPR-associated helicase Cas3' [Amycolatopsis cihanbeyliensis]
MTASQGLAVSSWLSAWAKSYYDRQTGAPTHWLPLSQHLADSARVAGHLVGHWLPPRVTERLGRNLPGGAEDVPVLAGWLAGVHDIGKLSPAFAVQVPKLADRMRKHSLVADPRLSLDPLRGKVSHSLVGHVAVRDWLHRELDFDRRGSAAQLASVVGSHHGIAPEHAQLRLVAENPHLAGTGTWAQARVSALRHSTEHSGGLASFTRFRDISLDKPTLVLLSAIVIMADWIASNSELFPLDPIATADREPAQPDDTRTGQRLQRAWNDLDLPPRWTPQELDPDLDAAFRSRFPHITTIRPVQTAAVQAARALREPGIIVIEAPMGNGKTEAALVAAEELARSSGAHGCFLALPTQATTDAMFTRAQRWLRALPRATGHQRLDVTLAHGKATLNDEFTGLVREGRFQVGDEADSITVHQWLRGSKKGPLASFVVGTIDQLLVAGLKSRHVMLRHLALAGKVVVIDEVHAYDVYMSQYLHRVLHWLGNYGVPVVLLSATLPARRRAELLDSYATGRGGPKIASTGEDPGYPVILSSGETCPRVIGEQPEPQHVTLDRLTDDLDALVTYLRRRLTEGGCAAVVRNTVTRVQETADRLAAEFGADNITVNHSRFLACDRAAIDTGLVRRFGPPGPDNDRSGPHIVVASQVLEQSLDVDFDMLVTDLAPMDLLLQRIGRLHRHDRARPAPVRTPRCAVAGTEDWSAAPVRAVAGSRRVYGEHTLLRAAALLADRSTVSLPTDIAPLVQEAYGDGALGPEGWQTAMTSAARAAEEAARERRERATHFLLDETSAGDSLVGWLQAGVGDADGERGAAQVRDGAESLEVLVVQRDRDGGLLTPGWIPRGGGQQIPLDQPVPAELARVIAACTLRLPLALSHEGVIDSVIRALEKSGFVTSFDQTPLLAGQLVLVLDERRQAIVPAGDATFLLTYDIRRGLLHERR